ncbi:FecR family protein [Chitinophaga sp. S165]|uniref:FecR family protein n=1 Tax=Chitinophaga sp. S165 TaxID=2135462 RepID=UPI000D719BBF|nr:FecR family protein [Chitinophaga sp. S165]PWV47072.1 FecR family protein [Chitinophaga sp. S165]
MDEEKDLLRIRDLMVKHSAGRMTASEQLELERWLENPVHRAAFEKRTNVDNILTALEMLERGESLQPASYERLVNRILSIKTTIRIWRFAAAATIVTVAAIVFMFYRGRQGDKKIPTVLAQAVLSPGGDRAYVVLEDGRQLDLEKSGNGALATQGGAQLVKTDQGRVDYKTLEANRRVAVYNTVVTPPGGQYRIVLSDGTGVWLNAASSIRFPTAFTGTSRQVRVTGEVYFEVAQDPSKPFLVDFGGNQIQVLGTRFNIKLYDGFEPVSTTLMQGAVKVSSPAGATLLRPGEQARIGSTIAVTKADTARVMAWKMGYFEFKQADIRQVMADIARWYDLEVKYEGPIPDKQLSARISRMKNANALLELLKSAGVNLKIENRTITVLP